MDKKRYIVVSIIVSALFTALEALVLMFNSGITTTGAVALVLLLLVQAGVLCVVFQKTFMKNIARVYATGPVAIASEK